jgi:hypothetical protein
LPIGKVEFDKFNDVVVGVMAGAGVTKDDQAATYAVLNTLQPDICNDPTTCKNSICDRYSRLLNITNVQLVKTVVVNTFMKAVDPASPIKGFFDGTTPKGSIDFTTNTAQQTRLVNDLVAFFGQDGILTCTDPGFPKYNNTSTLKQIHSAMPIGTKEFTTFNDALIQVLKEAGVADNDRTAVRAILDSTKSEICNQPDCSGNVTVGIKFVFDVVPKVHHPFTGIGFSSGFQVDGLEGRPLMLVVGKSYTFQNNGGCTHPLYISTSIDGASDGEVSTGVTYPGGDPFKVCNGNSLTYVPDISQVGVQMYYQCRNHMRMGYTINVFKSTNDIPVTTGSGTITLEAGTTGVPATTGAANESSDAFSVLPSLMMLLAAIALLL